MIIYMQDSIPVVLGGLSKSDYLKFLPPNSYINVEDFESPKKLAEYLIFLNHNPIEYNKYHAWRKDYEGKEMEDVFPTVGQSCRNMATTVPKPVTIVGFARPSISMTRSQRSLKALGNFLVQPTADNI